jgi:hypothetical protein
MWFKKCTTLGSPPPPNHTQVREGGSLEGVDPETKSSMLFPGAQKSLDFQGPTPLPLALVMDLPASKALHTGRINYRPIKCFVTTCPCK